MKQLFPLSVKAKKSVGDLIVAIIIYVGLAAIIEVCCNVLHIIPFLGTLVGNIITKVVDIYCLVGVILSFLFFFKVVK